MNKYLLTFRNEKIEAQYQNTSIGEIRMTMFSLITLGFVVVFIVRIGQGLLQQNYLNVVSYISMIIYFSVQYFLAKRYRSLLRGSLILLNHAFTIYFLYFEESTDTLSAHLRGANQMGSNFLIILAGEYIDAMFSLISISIIRIIIIFIKSSSIEYSAIFTAFIMILYASKYLYQYHKAIRSQYLLTLVEQSWDNILDQIVQKVPFILIKFDEEVLKFSIEKVKNCDKFFSNINETSMFLRESFSNNQTLEQIIYKQILQFQQKRLDQLGQIVEVNYNKIQIQLEFSIFFGNQPTILLVFSNDKIKALSIQTDNTKKFKPYFNFLINFSKSLLRTKNKEVTLKEMIKKFIILKLLQDFKEKSLKIRTINLSSILLKIQSLYPEQQIKTNIQQNLQVESCNSLVYLFFICIFESLLSNILIINYESTTDLSYQFSIKGIFQVQHLQAFFQDFGKRYNLILADLKINQNIISFKLHKQAFQPFEY